MTPEADAIPQTWEAALAHALRMGVDRCPAFPATRTWGPEAAMRRFLGAWEASGSVRRDEVVLLRQVVRWNGGRLAVGTLHPSVEQAVREHGPAHRLRAEAGVLVADPFAPAWSDAVAAVDTPPQERRPDTAVPAEQFLRAALPSRVSWQSGAQREAVWRVISAPERSTTLVALPTGAGKSLCFQMLAARTGGLTVVVVPTVALAIDHCHGARRLFTEWAERAIRYYAAADPTLDAQALFEDVRSGACRLLFCSPESCIQGALRRALTEEAEAGRLQALCIDEAHLVESWGMYFRPDFQLLAALRRRWLKLPNCRLRTVLLSATFTPECREMLKQLFAEKDTPYSEAVSMRARPEMVYFEADFSTRAARDDAVREAVACLPRPAILYVTRRDDANAWGKDFRGLGYHRLAVFHGDTTRHERARIIDQWARDELDLVVATSAFGLGVDKPDVRAVIHACLPEDMHRYCQEVGRGGRDGASAVCVLLTHRATDEPVARSLTPTLLSADTLRRRWQSMWQAREVIDGNRSIERLSTYTVPPNLWGTDVGKRNIAWNRRLLMQLARAGHLDLLDVEYVPIGNSRTLDPVGTDGDGDAQALPVDDVDVPDAGLQELITIERRFTAATEDFDRLIGPARRRELGMLARSQDALSRYLAGEWCMAQAITRLYGEHLLPYCSGCPVCRRSRRVRTCPPLPVPEAPPAQPAPAEEVVVGVPADPHDVAWMRLWRACLNRNVTRWFCPADWRDPVEASLVRVLPPGRLYRIDAAEPHALRTLLPSERAVIVHHGQLLTRLLRAGRGTVVIHMVTEGTPYHDAAGYVPLEQDGAPFTMLPSEWS